jgi:hypothetical protein
MVGSSAKQVDTNCRGILQEFECLTKLRRKKAQKAQKELRRGVFYLS